MLASLPTYLSYHKNLIRKTSAKHCSMTKCYRFYRSKTLEAIQLTFQFITKWSKKLLHYY